MSNAWMLVVVTLGGDISSSNYPTESACKDALSIAQTGMTVEEDQDAHIKWYASHIPHAPNTIGEKALARAASAGLTFDAAKYHVPYHVTEGGKIQDDPPTVASKIKSGRCLATGD